MSVNWNHDAYGRFEALAEDMTREIAAEIADDARRLCPVDTGVLRSSIDWVWEGGAALIVADAPYAGYVELGTSKMAAQPFLRPALYRQRGG